MESTFRKRSLHKVNLQKNHFQNEIRENNVCFPENQQPVNCQENNLLSQVTPLNFRLKTTFTTGAVQNSCCISRSQEKESTNQQTEIPVAKTSINSSKRLKTGSSAKVQTRSFSKNDSDGSFRMKLDRQKNIRHQQQRLLILLHAEKCPYVDGRCPVTPNCAKMKQLWKHIAECRKHKCPVPHCDSSRYILYRYYKRKQASDNQNMNQNRDPIKEEKQQLQCIKTQKAKEKYQQNQQLYSQQQDYHGKQFNVGKVSAPASNHNPPQTRFTKDEKNITLLQTSQSQTNIISENFVSNQLGVQIHPQQKQYLHNPKMHQTLLSEAFIDCIPLLHREDHNYSTGVSKHDVSSIAKSTIRLISKGDQFDCFSTEQLGTHIDCLHKALQLHNIYNINL